jgi:hypothetical protein
MGLSPFFLICKANLTHPYFLMQLNRDECARNYCLSKDALSSHALSISADYINLFCESKIVKLLKKLSESIGVHPLTRKITLDDSGA